MKIFFELIDEYIYELVGNELAMQKNLNLKVKFRESFRPFAPSVLAEEAKNYFNLETNSPYMMMVSNIKEDKQIKMTDIQNRMFGIEKLNIKRSVIPAVTHVDYSARIQTVDGKYNERYFNLIKKFYEISNCPVVISGGVSSINDIKKAKDLNNKKIEGIIVGKAIYDGDIKLDELAKEIDA